MQAGVISGTIVGPQIGNANLLEDSARWGWEMGCRAAAHAGAQRECVLLGIPAIRGKLREETHLPTDFDQAHHAPAGEFGVGHLLQGLGADLGAKTEVYWAPLGSLRKRKAPAAAGLSKVPTPYPADETPEMRHAPEALCAETDGPEGIRRLYRAMYYAPSPGTGPCATGYYLANIVFVKNRSRRRILRWWRARLARPTVKLRGRKCSPISAMRGLMRLVSLGEPPKGSQIAASPDASQPSTAPRLFDRCAESPPIAPASPKRRPRNPLATRRARVEFAPFRPPRPPRGPVSRGCENCRAAYSEVSARRIRRLLGNATPLVLE